MTTSLESAIKTFKVNVGAAPRMQGERTIGSGEFKMCPRWAGNDLLGREVSPDSFYAKTAGCQSALDRVLVENQVSRPRYYTYIALSPRGLTGDIYNEGSGPEYLQQPLMVEPYHKMMGFGTGVTSAIASTVPDERMLRAEEIYLQSSYV